MSDAVLNMLREGMRDVMKEVARHGMPYHNVRKLEDAINVIDALIKRKEKAR